MRSFHALALVPALVAASPVKTTALKTSSGRQTLTTTTITKATGIPQVTGTCAPYALAVVALAAWEKPASAFCTSWIPITTVTVTASTTSTSTVIALTSTVTADTSTIIATADATTLFLAPETVTAEPSTAYKTVVSTSTVTAEPAQRICGGAQKRGLKSTSSSAKTSSKTSTSTAARTTSASTSTLSKVAAGITRTLPAGIPGALKGLASSYIASACNCLHLPTPTSTTTLTIVPTTTQTHLATDTPLATMTVTPTATITPEPATETPTTTVTVTSAEIVTVPGVILSSPTSVTSINAAGVAQSSYDDGWFTINLPFALQLYGVSSSTILMSVNGHLALSGTGSDIFVNRPLPSGDLPDTCFVAYWSDLFIYSGTPQGLYYQVSGAEGSRIVAFEWYTSTYGDNTGYYHFLATLYENNPGAVTYDYYQILARPPTTNAGVLGTIGVQKSSTGQYAQFSFNNQAPIGSNMRVAYDPSSNSFTRSDCSS